MLYVKPYFYDNFFCKAGECKDTCCAGWEITVDNATLEYYSASDCSVSAEIMRGITVNSEGESVFRLKEKERCHFLCNDGLCRIYTVCGKDALCDICREHPRFYNCYDDSEEAGLGLCCEKVCELLFADDEPFNLISEGVSADDDYNNLFSLRKHCFDMIYVSDNLNENIKNVLEFIADQFLDYTDVILKEFSSKCALFTAVGKLFAETEPINNEWTQLIANINNNISKIASVSDLNIFKIQDYRKILSYIIYRHLLESAYTNDILDGICFAVVSLIFIHMYDCFLYQKNSKFTYEDRIDTVKFFSKQIEYSAENTDHIMKNSVFILFDKAD